MKNNYQDDLKKHGWILIKDFFDADYCENLRVSAHLSLQDGFGDTDLLSNKHLNHLFCNEKLINLLNEIIGDKPVYFGDSSFQIASVSGGIASGFHKDSIDRKNYNGIDFEDDYSLIRVGIYLQDHKNFSEGLVVRDQSHKSPDLSFGKKINVPSKSGDLIIWYLTTTHAGNAKRIKFIDYPVLMNNDESSRFSRKLYTKLPKKFIKPSQKDRIAIFATFGKKDRHLERYVKYVKHRMYMLQMLKKNNFDENIINKINASNKLKVLNLKEYAENVDLNTFVEYDFNNFKDFEF